MCVCLCIYHGLLAKAHVISDLIVLILVAQVLIPLLVLFHSLNHLAHDGQDSLDKVGHLTRDSGLALGKGDHELETEVAHILINVGAGNTESHRQHSVNLRAQEAGIGVGNFDEAREALLSVGHVSAGKCFLEDGEASGEESLERLLVSAVLLLDDVRHDASNGLEARHTHRHRLRSRERLAEDRHEGLQEGDNGLVTNFEGERGQNV